jgi:Tfp pilus assembly PilM family ATPase
MIKALFLPTRIGTTRLIAERIIGLSLTDTHVHAVVVYAKRSKTIIEKTHLELIEPGNPETVSDRTAQAIKRTIDFLGHYNVLRVSLPASMVIFKELTMLFTDPEKIRMVLDYEIETMLPYSLQEAVIDFIITKKTKEPASSQLLVAAVRSQDLANYLSIFEKAGVNPAAVTVDLLSLYSLYAQIPTYNALTQATALVELGPTSTRIAFVLDGQLRVMRYIHRGIESVIASIVEEAQCNADQLRTNLQQFGITGAGDEASVKSAQKHFANLLNDIQFTLNSFSLKLNFYDGLNKVFFTGMHDAVSNFIVFCSNTLQVPCEIFDTYKVFENKKIKNKLNAPIAHWAPFTTPLGTALPSNNQLDFDLRRKQFAFHHQGLLVKQITVASLLAFLIISTLGVRGYMDTATLQHTITNFEKKEINKLKAQGIFPREKFPKGARLAKIIRDGERIIKDKQAVWAAFSQKRMKTLEILLELTRLTNKKQFDITVRSLSLSNKDEGITKVEFEGIFKSKTEAHFQDFNRVEAFFKESLLLKVIDTIDATPIPDGGVNFTVKFRLKEE